MIVAASLLAELESVVQLAQPEMADVQVMGRASMFLRRQFRLTLADKCLSGNKT